MKVKPSWYDNMIEIRLDNKLAIESSKSQGNRHKT